MKERTAALLITLVLVIAGVAVIYLTLIHSGFNFYRSEITSDGNIIKEKLFYQPDKPYHTLYRNFYSTLHLINESQITMDDSIGLKSVSCQEGQAYLREYSDYWDCYFFPGKTIGQCPSFTESNEYGCTFGDTLGFQKGKEYTIESNYELYPRNIFNIDNKHYIKFVVYSAGNHKLLVKGSNFIIPANALSEKYYLPVDDVIIYLPYENLSASILKQDTFLFDTNYGYILFIIIISLLPAILFLLIWFFLGREKSEPDIPKELSMAPNKRRAWEVAAYFNPPFAQLDKNFFASLLLDFYRRKIIDLKMVKEKNMFMDLETLYVKINKNKIPADLDEIETKFLSLLQEAKKNADKDYIKAEYFSLEDISSTNSSKLRDIYSTVSKTIKEESKTYLSKAGTVITGVLIVFFLLFATFLFAFAWAISIFYIAIFIFVMIFNRRSALLLKFRGDYYQEYRHWQAFKRYLSHSYTIESATHETIVMWGEYLLYATALGVPEKVLKEGEKLEIIDQNQMAIYSGVYYSSASFSTSYASATGSGGFGGGGGFGGAGGGGIGGGGGGGR